MRTEILLNRAFKLCWYLLTMKFTSVFSKAVVGEPWPNFVNRFCWNCHYCLPFESRITGTKGQNREYSSVKNHECKRDWTLSEQRHQYPSLALFSWSTIGREIHVICVWFAVVWRHSSPVLCSHSREKNRNHKQTACILAHGHILQRISRPFFREARHIKFIQSHEPNFSIACSDYGPSFRKFASYKTHIRIELAKKKSAERGPQFSPLFSTRCKK